PRDSLPTGGHCRRHAQHELAMGRGTDHADTDERLIAREIDAQQAPWTAGVTILIQDPGLRLTHESIEAETLRHYAAALRGGLRQNLAHVERLRPEDDALVDANATPADGDPFEMWRQRSHAGAADVDPRRHDEAGRDCG